MNTKSVRLPIFTALLATSPFPMIQAVTLTEVAQHALPTDCWTVVDDTVFDITAYIPSHPRRGGGAAVIYGMCGRDGTALYDTAHATEHIYLTTTFRSTIRNLGPVTTTTSIATTTATTSASFVTTKATPATTRTTTTTAATAPNSPITTISSHNSNPTSPTITLQELGLHDQANIDCWVAYHSHVYDLTTYQHPKPVGNSVIFCGTDSTDSFAAVHDNVYLDMITDLHVGSLLEASDDEEDVADSDGDNEGTGGETVTSPSDSTSSIDGEQLQAHNSTNDCWTVYLGNVYDITAFAPTHPVAGPAVLWEYCGRDGTAFYSIYHDASLLLTIQPYYRGPYQGLDRSKEDDLQDISAIVTSPREMTHTEVQFHDLTTDCWTILYGSVYDLTRYRHPGVRPDYGQRVIYEYSCGGDSTRDYAAVHPRDLLGKTQMDQKYKIGWVSSAAAVSLTSWIAGSVMLLPALFFTANGMV
uniref:Cytochrome b5 heme-binding domain-containing protein n=1 Tax=Amphora coffeiformis TaxID=265554 RepID=A0A7S3LFU7_9STRA|mmetsp:Transcript_13753/g.27636  ORF Transcript_13753/g.27636 Transcript_13753/m.27636 type:complete len:472 (+) Transcript_13753:109-1524(+)